MEERENTMIPYVVLESERARHERLLKDERDRHEKERKDERIKWFIVVLVLLILCFGTNAGWLAYESQFTDEEITQEVWQDAENGINRFIGGDYYGSAASEDYSQTQNP